MEVDRSRRNPRVEELVSAQDLAKAWKCHACTVARILRRAGIEPVIFTASRNGLKRWRRSDVERFLRERTHS